MGGVPRARSRAPYFIEASASGSAQASRTVVPHLPSERSLTGALPLRPAKESREQPDFKRLDLALRYDLPLVRGITVALTGEIYNTLSEENFLSVGNNIAGTAGFLTPTSTYNPGGRQYQLGVRLGL